MAPPVTLFAALYGAGLWVGLVVLTPSAMLWTAGAGMAAAILSRRWRGALTAAFLVGVLAGAEQARTRSSACVSVWPPGDRAVVLRVHDAAGPGAVTRATVEHSSLSCGGTLRVRAGDDPLPAGRRVIAVGRYRPGAFSVGRVRVLDGPPARRFAIRAAVARRIRRLYGPRAEIVEALVLGRRDNLSPAIRQRFVEAGLAHLLAISGLHVGILAAWLLLVARRALGRRWAWAASVGATWVYVGLLGFPAPATRAAAFLTIGALARIRQRHPPPAAVLGVAALTVLAIDPNAVTAVGAWLSAAAVWGTAWSGQLLSPGARHIPVVRLAAASAGAVAATAPITAFAFGSVSPAGLVTNLVAVPLAGVAVPGVFASLVGGSVLAAGSGAVLTLLEQTAEWGARLPGGHLAGVPGPAFAWPWAVGLAVAVCAERVRPTRATIRTGALAAGVAWVLLSVINYHPSADGRTLSIHVLDVGQGDAIALRTPVGRWLLIDAGPRALSGNAGRRVVAPFLRHRNVTSLAALVVTHGDADHVGGAAYVAGEFAPALVLEPGQPLGSRPYIEFLGAVDSAGLRWRAARAGDTLRLDGVTIAVLHPSSAWVERQFEPNENSVVLRVSYGCFDAMLMGDAGEPVEELLRETKVEADVLKIGHHGSSSATTDAWIDAVRPKVGVISVGRRNRYGHPAPEVLRRLADRHVRLWRTDRDGPVTIESDGRYLTLAQGRLNTVGEAVRCRILRLLRSSDSSSSKRSCTRRPPVSLPACSTTSPSLQR